ncbi:M1 family aminopeptidase, partial [Shewanella sp. MBTL60-112-B1]|uniref:M1 family aminopeptidase n=1 Tax=Shewanella sp. MBTL60-112-B1 TaxID=2815916 RepID=UPI00217F50A3
NKGAEVIRMMHTLLGEIAFQQGMKLYFKRHDGQAVTCDDFVAGNLNKAHHAMASLKKSMAWDESRFDLEYDLDIYMIVAVDFFN